MENNLLQIAIQGGLTSVALLTIWVLYKLTSNHMARNSEAMIKNTKAITKLTTVIEDKIK